MTDLSDRFAALMARMAKSDADLYRTISEQNANVRQLVDELSLADSQPATSAAPIPAASDGMASLPAAGLLPAEQCELKALKARFTVVADAQRWLEAQIGKAPKKPTWAVIQQTCRQGAWPTSGSGKAASPKALTAAELDARLSALEQRLEQRLLGLELLLRQMVAAVRPNG